MRFQEYSHRHGRELMKLTHEEEMNELIDTLSTLSPFPHGQVKNATPKESVRDELVKRGWIAEAKIPLGTGKNDYCDLLKNKIALEQEYSRFEMFFRDFFRFLLLYDRREIDIAVIVTYDDSAFKRWGSGVSAYSSERASLDKLEDFLEGDYSSVVRFPLWCIGIE